MTLIVGGADDDAASQECSQHHHSNSDPNYSKHTRKGSCPTYSRPQLCVENKGSMAHLANLPDFCRFSLTYWFRCVAVHIYRPVVDIDSDFCIVAALSSYESRIVRPASACGFW